VQPSHVFDAGLGELFTCRNAGNLLDELTIGSLEYAVAHTGCPLVVIMGHTCCGASGAAVAWAKNPEESESHNIDDVLRRFSPAVIATMGQAEDDREWADLAVRKNVELECRQLMQRSPLIAEAVRDETIWVIGVVYDLESGLVELAVSSDECLGNC
jgi:carbonic anhydrase